MNTLLWLAQGALAAVFAGAGLMKLSVPKGRLETWPGMGYVTEHTATQMKLIGVAEVLGSLGLVLPWWLGIVPVLTPMAATGLVVLMGGAIATHRRRREPSILVTLLALLAAFVAAGRSGLFG
jgi:hypothetical protein